MRYIHWLYPKSLTQKMTVISGGSTTVLEVLEHPPEARHGMQSEVALRFSCIQKAGIVAHAVPGNSWVAQLAGMLFCPDPVKRPLPPI